MQAQPGQLLLVELGSEAEGLGLVGLVLEGPELLELELFLLKPF